MCENGPEHQMLILHYVVNGLIKLIWLKDTDMGQLVNQLRMWTGLTIDSLVVEQGWMRLHIG
jgi:hypothetical protein